MVDTQDTALSYFLEDDERYLTPRGRANFVAIAKKFISKGIKGASAEGSYSLSLCFQPTVDLSVLKDRVKQVALEEFKCKDIFNTKLAKGLKHPFNDAEEIGGKPIELLDEAGNVVDLAGWTVIRMSSKERRPLVRDIDGENLDDTSAIAAEAYSGRWMRAIVNIKSFDVGTNKGVTMYLDGVQVLKHAKASRGGGMISGASVQAVRPDDDYDETDPLG